MLITLSLRLLACDEEQGLNVTDVAFEIVHCPKGMKDINDRYHQHMGRNMTKPSSCRPVNGLTVSNSLTLHKREKLEGVREYERESTFLLININIRCLCIIIKQNVLKYL
jgi:hypothetical protein